MPTEAAGTAGGVGVKVLDCPLAATPGDHSVTYDPTADHWDCQKCGGGGDMARFAELTAAQLDDMPPDDDPPLDIPEGFRLLSHVLEDPEALEPPRPVVPRLAWAGRVTLLAAREKQGKSTLASAAAAAVTAGAEFLEGPGRAGRVLWVGLEEHTSDLVMRLHRFGANANRLLIADRLDRRMEQLANAARLVRPVLIVVDTLAAFVDGLLDDPGSSTAWTPIMLRLCRIARETGAAILLIHHSRKSDGTYRDSTAIGAGADAVIEMKLEGADRTARRLETRARFAVPETMIRLDGAAYRLVGTERSLDERVIDFVTANPGCSKSQVRQGVTGKAVEIYEAIDRLLGPGELVNRGTERGFRLYAAEQTGNRPENRGPTDGDSLEKADGIGPEPLRNGPGEPLLVPDPEP